MKKVFYIRDVETNSYFCMAAAREYFTPKLEKAYAFKSKKTAEFHLEFPVLLKGRTLEICEFYKESE